MNRFFKTVLLTGLFVGTTDLLDATISQWITSGKYPDKMLRGIASVAIGEKNAFPGNDAVALLGLFFHYFIAFSFTLFFFLIFPRIKFLRFNKYLIGMLYGVFVNLAFNQLILPIFGVRFPFSVSSAFFNWVLFGIIFGFPIVYNAYGYYKVKDTNGVTSIRSSNSSPDWPSQHERIESSQSAGR